MYEKEIASIVINDGNIDPARVNPALVNFVTAGGERLGSELTQAMIESLVALWLVSFPGIPAIDSESYYAEREQKIKDGELQSRIHSVETAIAERNAIIEESKRMIDQNEKVYAEFAAGLKADTEKRLAEERENCDQSNAGFQAKIDEAMSELPALQQQLEELKKEQEDAKK